MSNGTFSEGKIFIQNFLDIFSLNYCVIKHEDELESTFILVLSELIKAVVLE